ncbi:MAG: hypothetical protein U9N87_03390 [Planctomycetota bacterium]|nr:hypothetical protein [Planctomycetota bacterium]
MEKAEKPQYAVGLFAVFLLTIATPVKRLFLALPGLGAKREKTAASIAFMRRPSSDDNLLLGNCLSSITQSDIGIICT